MNRKVFVFLVILMGISIVGIIAVQLIWINNAVNVKNELFDRSVNEAMINTVGRLEKYNNLKLLSDFVFLDSTQKMVRGYNLKGVGLPNPPPFPYKKNKRYPAAENRERENIIIKEEIRGTSNGDVIQITMDSKSKANSYGYTYVVSDSLKKAGTHGNVRGVVMMSNNSFTINTDSLIKIGEARIDSIVAHLDTIRVASPDVRRKIEIKAGNLKHLTGRYFNEIAFWDKKNYDLEWIDSVFSVELRDKEIPVKYQIGIIKNNKPAELIPQNSDSLKVALSGYKVNLFPEDIFQKGIKLSVFFPGRDRFVYRSMSWLLLSSMLFSMIVLLSFALSIYYLLLQKKISEMKSDFINNMTHEFKTPIATISVAADSITNDRIVGDPEKIRYFAGMIKKENSRMNRQVEDILTIARLEKKDFEFKWEKIDIHDIISDAIQGITLQLEKNGGIIKTVFKAQNPVITTDKIHCTNVFLNLFDNAIKYSENHPEITVTSENTRDGIIISVEDKGIGMSKSVQAKIFERFYRQTMGNIHNVKGFGLGLSYAKAVIYANRGTISVQSEPEKGSKFNLFLPFFMEQH